VDWSGVHTAGCSVPARGRGRAAASWYRILSCDHVGRQRDPTVDARSQVGCGHSLVSCPAAPACPRVWRSSLPNIDETWWPTVLGLTRSRSASSLLRSRCTRSARTSSSRAVTPAALHLVRARGPRGTALSPSSRGRRAACAAAGVAPSARSCSCASGPSATRFWITTRRGISGRAPGDRCA